MKYKLLIILNILLSSLYFPQNVSKIEFHHSNGIILFKSIDIVFEPIKNSRKGKIRVKVKKDRDEEYFYRISKEKFTEIHNACLKIKYDTVAVKNNLIDGSYTNIELYDNLGNNKNYSASGLNKKSQNDDSQKDFWYATKLIIKAAGLEMEDMIGYR
jgi:hypothetical protein